jgi:hypothetical protein
MSPDQKRELTRFHARLNDQGESLIKGSIPWLLSEIDSNIRKIEELMGPRRDRVHKKELKVILRDLKDQFKELLRRLD